MPRKLRYLPAPALVEVTCRTLQRRFLLRPSPQLTEIVVGTLARAQQRYRMRVCAFVYLSNHCHLLLHPTDAKQLADFMRYVNSKIAREVARLHDWSEKVWGRRYADVVVSDEPEAQVARLRYLLEQGSKEGLVASPRHWPGASSTKALMRGDDAEGVWIDRTAQFRAYELGKPHPDALFTTRHRLKLSPLPCWKDIDEAHWRAEVRRMVREIEDRVDGDVLGKRAILAQHPHARPATPVKPSPAPRFHAVRPRVRLNLELAYHLARRVYRQAYEDLLNERTYEFPPGCFPPALAFVPLRT